MKITHHYKSIISALAALALFYSAAPRAGILDGGEIQFHGLVTDEAPKWTWQVGSPDQTWAVDTADARTESGQLVFDLRGKGSLPFLEGHLYEVAERGGPGFTPFITFSSNGQPFSVTAGGSTTAQHFRASVPVREHTDKHESCLCPAQWGAGNTGSPAGHDGPAGKNYPDHPGRPGGACAAGDVR